MTTAYVDASALVKLALDEPDGIAMRRWYHEHERVASSRVAVIETRRAVRRKVDDPAHVDAILKSIEVLEVSATIVHRASSVDPPSLRTLDAIHLASALELGLDLDAFVTYDDRLADAARAVGLPVVRPA